MKLRIWLKIKRRLLKRNRFIFFENLSRKNQENIVDEKWKLRVPISSTIHSKFYLLKNDMETRLIFGSANLSFQAFSNKRNQFENIVIFDNSPLFTHFIYWMLGLSKSKPILYNNIIPTGRTKKADTITQIQLWMNENNVAPILIDEIDEEFFSNKDRGNNLIVNVSNLSTSNFDFTPCFIGTTNALEYSLPQRAQRRSYYVKNDKVFDTELKKKSVKAYTEVFEIINDTLFQDFVIRFAEKLTDDNLSWKNYSLHSSTGLIDFLYWSREIFKDYFEIAQIEIPAWFPETRYDDTVENNQSLWRKLYEYNHQDFKIQKEKGVYLFKLKSLDSEEGQSNRFGTKILPSTKYLNALSQKCKNDNNSSDIIEIKIKEFHDWIGVPLPKELEHKKTILDFFKKKKNEKWFSL